MFFVVLALLTIRLIYDLRFFVKKVGKKASCKASLCLCARYEKKPWE